MKKKKGSDESTFSVEVDKGELLSFLSVARKFLSKTVTLPILGGVLMEAVDDDHLILTMTDLDTWIRRKVSASACRGETAVLDSKELIASLKEGKEGNLTISKMRNSMFKVKNSGAEFGLVSFDPEEFPDRPKSDGIVHVVTRESMLSLTEKTEFASFNDANYCYNINGVHFSSSQKRMVQAVGTNGQILSLIRREGDIPLGKDGITIPINAVRLFMSLLNKSDGSDLKDVRILFDSKRIYIFLVEGSTVVCAKLIEGVFPEVEPLFKEVKSYDKEVSVHKETFLNLVKAAITVSGKDKERGGAFLFKKGTLTLTVSESGLTRFKETMSVKYGGSVFNSIINLGYVRKIVESFDSENITFSFGKIVTSVSDYAQPIFVKGEESPSQIALIRPMRP